MTTKHHSTRLKNLILIVLAVSVLIVPAVALSAASATSPTHYYLTVYYDGLPALTGNNHFYPQMLYLSHNQTFKGVGPNNTSLTSIANGQYEYSRAFYSNTTVEVIGELYMGISNATATPYTSYLPSFSSGNFTMDFNQTLVITYTLATAIHPVKLDITTTVLPAGLNYTVVFSNTINGTVYSYTAMANTQLNITIPSGFYHVNALSANAQWYIKSNYTAATNSSITLAFVAIVVPSWQSQISDWLYSGYGITFNNLVVVIILLIGLVLFLIMNWLGYSITINFLPVLAMAAIGYVLGIAPLWFPIVMLFVYAAILLYARSSNQNIEVNQE